MKPKLHSGKATSSFECSRDQRPIQAGATQRAAPGASAGPGWLASSGPSPELKNFGTLAQTWASRTKTHSLQRPRSIRFFCQHCVLLQAGIMSTAFRSVAPFLRTARCGLKNGRVNPLQSALKPQTTAGMLNICRSYAVFERSKPHVNIGTPDEDMRMFLFRLN